MAYQPLTVDNNNRRHFVSSADFFYQQFFLAALHFPRNGQVTRNGRQSWRIREATGDKPQAHN
jgi:hypothetical protein